MNFRKQTTREIATDMRNAIADMAHTGNALIKISEARDDEVNAHPGFRFCRNSTCGVEIRHGHPTRACRSHRADGRTRPPYRAPLAITPAWARVTALGWDPM